ncbi:MAG: S9 family peptidase [Blastocatellia bacterium]
MAESVIAPYGSWKSPITSDLIVAGVVGLGAPLIDGADIYWLEMRPAEKGRCVIVRRNEAGHVSDVTPAPYSARTRVHEYGGGAFTAGDGVVYFANFTDQQIYRHRPGEAPEALTTQSGLRYADFALDMRRGRLICVCEDHRMSDHEPLNTIVSVALDGSGEMETLVSGHDFFAAPRLSPDGETLCWLSWDHPRMPWDGTELWTAPVHNHGDHGGHGGHGGHGAPGRARKIAGGPEESITQPQWSPDGTLHFISDSSGWCNLYRLEGETAHALCPMENDFGAPHWTFGVSTWGFLDADQILCSFIERGSAQLSLLNTRTGRLHRLETPFSRIDGLRTQNGCAVFAAAGPLEPNAIVLFDGAKLSHESLRQASDALIDPWLISVPRAIEFPTADGLTAWAFYYPPRNPRFRAPLGELPPLLVEIHGGPTAAAFPVYSLGIQYWTSRGFGVVDVNYGGSTGYGRAYRERLRGAWGVVDVQDVVNAAQYLVARGEVDGARLAITGGSAGGYTALAALTFHDVFRAGASHYGVSDCEVLARDTHKFESRYLDSLIGPYPEKQELYRQRSPLHHTDQLNAPVIFFQGLEDKIVPPDQAEMMVAALREKGLPVAYVPFEGEQHGFRQAANIKRALDGEFWFYSRVFGFEPADPLDPLEICNAEAIHGKEQRRNPHVRQVKGKAPMKEGRENAEHAE